MASLAGSFLVARHTLTDPNFLRAVVLLLAHDEGGAYGVVVNRPVKVDEVPFPVFVGGPCESQGVILVHGHPGWINGSDSTKGHSAPMAIADGIFIGDAGCFKRATEGSPEELSRVRVFRNYSGWGSGQLEQELAEGSWEVSPARGDILFDTAVGELWLRLKRPVIPQPSLN